MANANDSPYVHTNALSDPNLSPQAIILASTIISGGRLERLPLSETTVKLAMWELEHAGHLGGTS